MAEGRRRRPVGVRGRNGAHVASERLSGPRRGGDVRHRSGVAVVGGLGDDESFAAGCDFGDSQRQIVGLAAGAGEDDLADRRRESRQKPVGIGVDAVVQVARVDVELGGLSTDRLDHTRMAMSDRRDVVVDVEVAAPLGVEHPDAFGPDHPDRLFIEKHGPSTEMAQALPDSLAQLGIEGARGLRIEGV